MTDFDQREQSVGIQYNANEIKIGFPIEQYRADMAEKQKRIEELLVSSTISEEQKKQLRIQLDEVERQRLDDKASYEIHINDLKERIARLANLAGQIPENLIEKAKHALAHNDRDKANQLFTQVEEQADPHIAAAAEAAYQRGKLADDAINYNDAFVHYHRATQLMPANTDYLKSTGFMSYTLGDYDKAIDYFELALASGLNTFDPDHPQIAIHRNNLGLAFGSKGDYDKAIECYEQALATGLKTFGPVHPQVAIYRNNLGSAWDSKGDYDKAIEYIELALASDLKTFGPDHPHVARDRNNLGSAWDSKGNYDKAIEYFELALASSLKAFGPDHPQVATCRNNLGSGWNSKGNYDKAIKYYELALASSLKIFGPDHPQIAICKNNLGLAWENKGNYDKAIKYYRSSLKILENCLGRNHPTTNTIRVNLKLAQITK